MTHTVEPEVAVKVGRNSCSRALYLHRGTSERLSLGICDNTCDKPTRGFPRKEETPLRLSPWAESSAGTWSCLCCMECHDVVGLERVADACSLEQLVETTVERGILDVQLYGFVQSVEVATVEEMHAGGFLYIG